ncbi:MAG: hypothetical protein RMK92_04690 [Armatimonadota bacterium]|nr:hypothetical protein [Armatimonadota bacterium]
MAAQSPVLEDEAWRLLAHRLEAVGFRRFVAEGDAEVQWGTRRLKAQRIEGDLESGWVTATGDVQLWEERGVFSASAVRVNLRTREGEMSRVRADVQGVLLTADLLRSDGNMLFMQQVTLTTCRRERPDFLLSAGSLSLSPQLRLRARQVSLQVGGRQWVTLPTLSRRIGRREPGEPFLPQLGYSRRRGLMLSYGDLLPQREVQVRYEVRVFTRHDPEVRFDLIRRLDRSGDQEPLRHLEPTERGATSFLETLTSSRWHSATQEVPKRGMFLSLRANSPVEGLQRTDLYLRGAELGYQTVSPLGRGLLETEWRVGRLRESPTLVTASRAVGLIRWQSPLLKWGSVGTDVSLEARAGVYPREDAYSWLRTQWGWYWGDEDRLVIGLGLSLAVTGGRSPFVFDQLETRREARFRLRWTAHWGVDVLAIWDLQHRRWRDWQVALTLPADCVQPRILWSSQQRQIQLQVGLVGR